MSFVFFGNKIIQTQDRFSDKFERAVYLIVFLSWPGKNMPFHGKVAKTQI